VPCKYYFLYWIAFDSTEKNKEISLLYLHYSHSQTFEIHVKSQMISLLIFFLIWMLAVKTYNILKNEKGVKDKTLIICTNLNILHFFVMKLCIFFVKNYNLFSFCINILNSFLPLLEKFR